MAKKTIKDLNMELNEVKTNFEDLMEKYVDLNNKYEKIMKMLEEHSIVKEKFNCDKCEAECDTEKSLKKHKQINHVEKGKFKCEVCEWEFNAKWKYEGHIKTCEKNSCDQCDNSFKTTDILNKHIQIAHDKIKIYCHYFNNDDDCPFNEDCVFLHEDSPQCKYGDQCERNLCMFQHNENDDSDEESEDDDDSEDEDPEEEDDTKNYEDSKPDKDTTH